MLRTVSGKCDCSYVVFNMANWLVQCLVTGFSFEKRRKEIKVYLIRIYLILNLY